MPKGETYLEAQAREQVIAEMFRAAMDASPHGIALRRGDEVLYSNPAWDTLMSPDREVVTSSYGFKYQGALLSLTLAHDVSERRKAERQLYEAQKLEALGRWVGGVVHDFNNLLTAVMLYSDMVAQSVDAGSAISRYNEQIREVAKRGAGLTGQLLGFLQQRTCDRVVISVNSLLKGLRDVLERMSGEDVQVVLDLAQEPCHVRMDPAQFQQVVFNLVLNARDAMSSCGTITVRTREIDADLGNGTEQCVRVEISDTGSGMDAQTQAHIFDPFFTTKPQGKGTGLGLTTVRDIVAEAGGMIAVQSEIDVGTLVAFTLPCTEPVLSIENAEADDAQLFAGSETLLVVEDDPAVRSSVVQTLSRCGYDVLQAGNGFEALAVARSCSGDISLLITDIVLPGLSGREVARRLSEVRPGIPVLFLSGYGTRTDHCLSNEIIFQKPFDTRALVARVRQTLEVKSASDVT